MSHNLEEELARLKRKREETERFIEEQHRLTAELMRRSAETPSLANNESGIMLKWAPWIHGIVALACVVSFASLIASLILFGNNF